jgi:hypothetical protein
MNEVGLAARKKIFVKGVTFQSGSVLFLPRKY